MKNKSIYSCKGNFWICSILHNIFVYVEAENGEFEEEADVVDEIANKALNEINPFYFIFGIDNRYFKSVCVERDDCWDGVLDEHYIERDNESSKQLYGVISEVVYNEKTYRVAIDIVRKKFENEK